MRNEKIQIDRLNNAKAAIAEAITAKGVQVPESTKLDGYPTLISQISTSGSGGGKSVRTCRIIIGTSKNGWTENDCDYLCDGINDVTIINNAIQAAPEGGAEIHLLDGSYSVASTINLKDNIMLTGNGVSTILSCSGKNFTSYNVVDATADNCVIQNLKFIFSGSFTGSSPPRFINISGDHNTIQQVIFSNSPGDSIKAYGMNNHIANNIMSGQKDTGIKAGGLKNSRIYGNYIDGGKYGIKYPSGGNHNIISANTFKGQSSYGMYIIGDNFNVSDNLITDFKGMAINIISGTYYTIVGNNINTINEANNGIKCGGNAGNILGNTISGALLTNTILLDESSKYVLISNNSLFKIDVKDSGYNNTVVNNKVVSTQAGGGTS